MKSALVFCVLFILVVVSARPGDEKYTTKYDNINLDDILNSDRLLRNYIDCILDISTKCTKDAEALKRVLPEALSTKCAKCSDAQKEGAKKVIHYLIKNKRAWWDELEAKVDPEHNYRTQYAQELKEAGIEL